MVVGVVVMLLISFKGIGDSKDLAAELNGSDEKQTEVAEQILRTSITKFLYWLPWGSISR